MDENLSLIQKIEIAERNLERSHNWVRSVDQKAGFTITVVLALLAASFSVVDIATKVSLAAIDHDGYLWIVALIIIALFLIYFFRIIQALWSLRQVVRPRTDLKGYPSSALYFGSIAEMKLDLFKQCLTEYDEESILDDICNQTHISSVIASEKSAKFNDALNQITSGVIFGILFILLTTLINALILGK